MSVQLSSSKGKFASVQMAVSPCRPTNYITTGIFETGTPTVLTSMATWRSHGSKTIPSTSASFSTYGRSPVTCSSVTWTCAGSSSRAYRSSVAGPFSNSIYTTTNSPSLLRCVRCTTWRCHPLEIYSMGAWACTTTTISATSRLSIGRK